MSKKFNAAKSYLPTEGGAAPAPMKRKRTARAKAAVAGADQLAIGQSMVKDVQAAAANGAETAASFGSSEQEEIARLAYFLWEARGGQGGVPEDDWTRAEQEYRKKREASIR